MGIKKKCREINKAKNTFLAWLKKNNADSIDVYAGSDKDGRWDYYRCVSAFISNTYYVVYFMMWQDEVNIDYSDDNNRYDKMSIEEFLQLID